MNETHVPADLMWSDRLTIIRANELDMEKPQVVAKVCEVFDCNTDQIDALLMMEASGDWQVNPEFDTTPYDHLFKGANDLPPLPAASATATATATPSSAQQPVATKPTAKPAAKQPPATASRTKRPPQKRGRKGTKIEKAFDAVPTEPTDAAAFAKKHDVSMAVLRQSKRFDKSGKGNVRVKQNSEKVLMIWREEPTAETANAVAGEGTQQPSVDQNQPTAVVTVDVAGPSTETPQQENTPSAKADNPVE